MTGRQPSWSPWGCSRDAGSGSTMECPLPRGATFGVPWEPLACAAAVAMRVPLSCPAGPQAMTRALWEAAAQFPLRQIEVEQTYRDARGHWAGFRRLGNTHHRLLEILCTWAERRSGRHCHYSMPQIAALLGVSLRWITDAGSTRARRQTIRAPCAGGSTRAPTRITCAG